MKQINFKNLNERNEFSLSNFLNGIEMEFIKHGKNYLIKGSNGIIVNEEEKLKLENEELIIQDFKSNNCQQETTKKIAKNKKRIKEIHIEEDYDNVDFEIVQQWNKETALQNKENADDTIKETDTTI